MHTRIRTLFEQAGCEGQLCVQSLDGAQEFALDADRPVVAASVAKLSVALEAETRFADGRLDPTDRVRLTADSRTPGPVGFSLYRDDVEVSLRDLVVAMLTISDNPATDALLHRVGIDAVNATMRDLGLAGTVLAADLRTTVDSIGQDAGFADWAELSGWLAQAPPQDELDRVDRQVRAGAALTPRRTNRTTPREMATFLRLIWSDRAGPPSACEQVRQVMSRQLTRNRLATGFRPPARVAAKSGGLVGIVRNEVGVVRFPDGRAYAVAVFTQARTGAYEADVNAVIGTVAAAAVDALTDRNT